MDDNGKTAFGVLVRALYIGVPPGLVLLLSAIHERACVETWKCGIAGCIVVAWSVGIGCWTFIARRSRVSTTYEKAFRISFYEHVFAFIWAYLMLDHGMALYSWVLASMVYWMTTGLIVTRRSLGPTPFDRIVIAHGFLLLYIPVSEIVWTMAFVRYQWNV